MNILQKARKVTTIADELKSMYFLVCRLEKSDKSDKAMILAVRKKIENLTCQLANELINSKSEIEKMLNDESEEK